MINPTASWKTTPLTPVFGAIVEDVSLADVARTDGFFRLRALFEEHSALLFRGQDITDEDHLALARRFGTIEDRLADERTSDDAYKVPKVSNVRADGKLTAADDLHTLHLKANFLWHADSTFLPVPALTNILIGRVVTKSGGATELASTRAAWAAMPESLKARVRGRGIRHRYSHSRAQISPELAKLPMFHKWPDQHWKSVWTNPVNGKEALYIASHAFAVDGYDAAESAALLRELMEFCTQPDFTYSHSWQAGDVLIWDQRAVLHRGTPWPEDQPRTLSSLCVSASDADGLGTMHIMPQ
ncbi:TauD/TfdA dioxygenase family protein [Shimia sp. Alg240-R146]|uniref:TauD/TfdA dioxygenase family protein n=1 Tax=Shimia sp. Alg240-R146 TaxID=2993449 RepID=UPI0022E6D417|nr:TauD/TfdA family dioxygenase [Shimia sp. Alg240-R146]